MAPRLGRAQREEHRMKAWELSGQGMTNLEIAEELDVNKNTVTSLIKEEKRRRKELFPEADLEAIRTYQAVIRSAWEDYKKLDKKSLNLSGLLNSIISAQKAIDDITGAKAPTRSESKSEVTFQDGSLSLEEEFKRLDEQLESSSVEEEE